VIGMQLLLTSIKTTVKNVRLNLAFSCA